MTALTGSVAGGDDFSPTASGHTGSIPASIWMDPVQRVFVILTASCINQMQNRNRRLVTRPLVHDAPMQDLRILQYETSLLNKW